MSKGKFVVSLDFEMMWGVRDHRTIASYGENIAAVRKVVPRLLETADEAGIHLTFGIVGMLMLNGKKDVLNHIPRLLPTYKDAVHSPYGEYIEQMTTDEEPYHFAPELVELIRQHPQHEIGTHTFCHYYCLEEGQTVEQFEDDLAMAQYIGNGEFRSIIFPRNQTSAEYLEVCKKYGILTYRGCERNALNTAAAHHGLLKRALRLANSYVKLTGYDTYTDEDLRMSGTPMDIPASKFLWQYNPKLRSLDWLRLRRIKNAMTHAAQKGETYHIWWHPHNFGSYTDENFAILAEICKHYKFLHEKYGFRSMTFQEVYDNLKQ